jgi:putative membrane protein
VSVLAHPARAGWRVGDPALVLAVATVLLQVAYPLVHGSLRDVLTVATVVVAALAVVTDAALRRGPRWAARFVLVCCPIAFLAEAVGVATGVPFGHYAYAASLGPRVAGVPLVIPLAWAMTAYPALLAGRRLAPSRTGTVAVGALVLTAWDLLLDPQMVEAGHWTWADPHPALPGVPGIPAVNSAGWLGVSVLLVAALDAALPRADADERVPALLLGWTWLGGTLAAAAFFGRPAGALVGGVALGVTVGPYLLRVLAARVLADGR